MANHTEVPNIIIRCRYLSHTAYRLFTLLASFKPSFPSYNRLQELTGMSSATISKALQELVKCGLISYAKGSSHGKANEYFVLPASDWKLPTSKTKVLQNLKYVNSESTTAVVSKAEPLQKLKSNKTNIKRPIKKDVVPTETTLFWNYYFEKAKFNGIEVIHEGAKTNTLCQNLVKSHGLEKAKRLVDVYLQETEPFVKDKSWPLGLLVTQQQKYVNQLNSKNCRPLLTFGEDE
jgi:predicted transcriptional regulator